MFKKLFGDRFSYASAKNRLQMVLVQDRSGLTASQMEDFKKDLLEVIAKYFFIDDRSVKIDWERHDSDTALVINTAIRSKIAAATSQKGSSEKQAAVAAS